MWSIVLLAIAAGVALVVLVAATGVVQRLFTDDCEKAYGPARPPPAAHRGW